VGLVRKSPVLSHTAEAVRARERFP
jgi:hypothetical protein